MNRKGLTVILGSLLLAWPVVAWGAVFIAEEDNRKAITSGDVQDDLYIFGNSVSVNHRIDDDLFAAANTVDIEGDVGQDLHAAGNTVRINGSVGDDVFAAGSIVKVTLSEADDVFAAGNMVDVSSDVVEGSIFAAGQKINIKGDVKGSVRLSGEAINIKSGTRIAGDLMTYGKNEPIIEDGVEISGETRHSVITKDWDKTERSLIMTWVTSVLIWFITAMALVYVWPFVGRDVVEAALIKGGKSLGIGFVWVALLIPTVILLMVTLVGWPLGLMVGMLSVGLLTASCAYSAVVVGAWAMKKFGKGEIGITWQHVLLGAIITRILLLVPVIGMLIYMVIVLLTLGAVAMVLWERLRKERVKISEES